jgi:ferredoxin-type protein NapF
MTAEINRMQFLTGDLSGKRAAMRPPWALPEAAFVDRCTRCGDCIPACPDGLITEGRGRFPQMDFSQGGCDFCAECVAACMPGALSRDAADEQRPWRLKATILDNCLSLNAVICRSCGEACDERAIRFQLELGGVARPILDQEACTGCGECFAVCPIRSIRISPVESQDQAA